MLMPYLLSSMSNQKRISINRVTGIGGILKDLIINFELIIII